MLVIKQVTVIHAPVWLAQPGRGIPADGEQSIGQPDFTQVPDSLKPLTNRDGHCHGLRLTGQLSEFLDELVSLGILNVEAHDLPFYPNLSTMVASADLALIVVKDSRAGVIGSICHLPDDFTKLPVPRGATAVTAREARRRRRYDPEMSLLRRVLLGSGQLPAELRSAVVAEEPLVLEEGLFGSVTYRHFPSPGENWRKDAVSGAVAVTGRRLVVWADQFKHIDVPHDDPLRAGIVVAAERPGRICFAYDVVTANRSRPGRVEVRLRTAQAAHVAELLGRLAASD